MGEPEYGVSTKVDADLRRHPGLYCLGIGIDQEAAIFISHEINGQPKFPCAIQFFRLGDVVEAALHPPGLHVPRVPGDSRPAPSPTRPATYEENEWWIKVSRAVGGVEKSYDFPPHVVRVTTTNHSQHPKTSTASSCCTTARGTRTPSCCRCASRSRPTSCDVSRPSREITLAGPLDPIAFWPHADTIGGSRWPGERGGPRPPPLDRGQFACFVHLAALFGRGRHRSVGRLGSTAHENADGDDRDHQRASSRGSPPDRSRRLRPRPR